jgi:peroxiredoxin Q/BCP
MKSVFGMTIILTALSLSGCVRMKMQPIKVEPVHMTLNINVKMQQQKIEDAAAETSPVMGKIAPDFSLPNQHEKQVTLGDFRGKWVVLYFYPKDGTTGCTIEAKEFTELLDQFHGRNAEVLGISEDSAQSHCEFIEAHQIELTLLSDPKHNVMESYGAWVKSSFGDMNFGRIIRVTAIIDPVGVIRHYMPEVIPQGHAERVLMKLEQLQNAPAAQ